MIQNIQFLKQFPCPNHSSPDTINSNPSGNSEESNDNNTHNPIIHIVYGGYTTSLSAMYRYVKKGSLNKAEEDEDEEEEEEKEI
jgi:hypothetical protein